MTVSLGLFIEGLVAILLLVTIAYCILVNRKLERLRSDQSELQRIVGELNGATAQAEAAIGKLRTNAAAAEETLSGYLEEVRGASAQLRGDVAQAETVIGKLATVMRAHGRNASAEPAPARGPHASRVGLGLLNAGLRGNGIHNGRSVT